MFYLKYRPQKFGELFGLESAIEVLGKAISSGEVAHAYLFYGPRGTGKTTAARLLAKSLNCESRKDNEFEPCGQCGSCAAVTEGSHLDLIEIDAASNRGVDDIRLLRDRVGLAPSLSEFKVYVIDEVHMLTREAFNALLKTLEEPPSHVVFVLCTTEPHRVPETVRSRCQSFEFRRAKITDLVRKLDFICKSEGIRFTEDSLRKIARSANGGFRDAETLLEKVSKAGESADLLLDRAGNPADLVELLAHDDIGGSLIFVNELVDQGADLGVFASDLLAYLRDLLLIRAGVGGGLVEATEDSFQKMSAQVAALADRLTLFITSFSEAQRQIRFSAVPQLPLELVIFDLVEPHRPKPKNVEVTSQAVKEASLAAAPPTEIHQDQEKVTSELDAPSWNLVLEEVKPLNHSIEALLRSAKLLSLDEKCLVLEVGYRFHKEQLELSRNRRIIEEALSKVFGSPRKLKCTLREKPKGEPVSPSRSEEDGARELHPRQPASVFNGDLLVD